MNSSKYKDMKIRNYGVFQEVTDQNYVSKSMQNLFHQIIKDYLFWVPVIL